MFVDPEAFHQDPLRPLRDGTAPERALERVVLSEPLERDVHRALHLLRVVQVREVGEDAEPGRPIDERAILHVEDRDHRAGGLRHDLLDELEGVIRLLAHDDEREVRQLGGGGLTNGLEARSSPHDGVAEHDHGPRDRREALGRAIRDKDAESLVSVIRHLARTPTVIRTPLSRHARRC